MIVAKHIQYVGGRQSRAQCIEKIKFTKSEFKRKLYIIPPEYLPSMPFLINITAIAAKNTIITFDPAFISSLPNILRNVKHKHYEKTKKAADFIYSRQPSKKQNFHFHPSTIF